MSPAPPPRDPDEHEPDGRDRDGQAADASMISCDEAVQRVYEFLDGELTPDWTEKVRAHVELCRKCYPYFNFERVFLDHVRSRGLDAAATARLEARVREVLEGL